MNGLFIPHDLEVIELATMFVDIVLIYLHMKSLFIPRYRLGKVIRHICLHTMSFVYKDKVRLGAILSSGRRSSAMFVDIT